jgi:polygalacturonase
MKALIVLLLLSLTAYPSAQKHFNVRDFGAKGDGKQLDTEAINAAVIKASQAGGGTVYFPAGEYLSFSIRLRSNITLHLASGCTIIAANMQEHAGKYDGPEPNIWGDSLHYQDFGHSHFRNSLIWGEALDNISIIGPGRIYGKGLQKWGDPQPGLGNKTISLKNCHNVLLRDFAILHGGHFAILVTGVDNLTINSLKIDTNRDAIDIDCCRHVRVSDCSLNSPNDDALVLKSSYALGYAALTENITITNCAVYGYDEGTFLDGTYQTTQLQAPDKGVVTGRIKLGTESNGAFRNITISNCTFQHCRGLALETVDGAVLENITVSNIVMDDILNAPFFLRLGSRMRGPENAKPGSFKRILIDNVVVTANNPQYASMIMGIPGYDVEDVVFSNIYIHIKGGGTKEQGAVVVPEKETIYPDPQEFGQIPAWGFYIRHAKNITMHHITLEFENPDYRPAFVIEDVKGIHLSHIQVETLPGVPAFDLKDVAGLSIFRINNLKDKDYKSIKSLKL